MCVWHRGWWMKAQAGALHVGCAVCPDATRSVASSVATSSVATSSVAASVAPSFVVQVVREGLLATAHGGWVHGAQQRRPARLTPPQTQR